MGESQPDDPQGALIRELEDMRAADPIRAGLNAQIAISALYEMRLRAGTGVNPPKGSDYLYDGPGFCVR